VCSITDEIEAIAMLANFAVFYAAVAVFYFAIQYLRSLLQPRDEPYVPPPTIDVFFIVRVFMQNGKWGLVLQTHKYYYRLPMLKDVCAESVDPGMRASLKIDFIGANNKPTQILVFTAPDELAFPLMMPKDNIVQMDAVRVVEMINRMQGELSVTSFYIMHNAQDEIQRRTGKRDFGWFVGK
jgi:hypothetical protein